MSDQLCLAAAGPSSNPLTCVLCFRPIGAKDAVCHLSGVVFAHNECARPSRR